MIFMYLEQFQTFEMIQNWVFIPIFDQQNIIMNTNSHQTLGEFIIENQADFIYSSGELSRLLSSIKLATKVVNYKVNKAGLVNILGEFGNENVQGEKQQKLDVFANDTFIETLSQREVVCGIASEENEDFIAIQP